MRTQLPLLTLALATLALVLPAFGEGVQGLLQYERGALAGGELWRLFTQHWTHWSAEHLVWDVLVFLALGAVCELRDRRRLLLTLAVSALAISLALTILAPGLVTCRGLSGLDSALFALLAADWLGWADLVRGRAGDGGWRRLTGGLALGLFLAKCGYEQATGETLFVPVDASGMVPVPLAHLVGFLSALFVAAVWPWLRGRAGLPQGWRRGGALQCC